MLTAPRPTAGRLGAAVRATLWSEAPPGPELAPGEVRRRRRVVAITLVAGAIALATGLNVEPGSGWFYVATFALAAIWIVGALLSNSLTAGQVDPWPGRRNVIVAGAAVGVALVGLFAAGAVVVQWIPALAGPVEDVLEYLRRGTGPLVVVVAVVNAVAEELFFRGALYDAAGRAPVVVTTAIYVVVTAASGNAMLAFAAVVLGVVVALERRATGGIVAPVVTHVVWSLGMLALLPPLF